MQFSIIRSTGVGLDLLKPNKGYITYVVRHPILEGPFTLEHSSE